MKTSLTWRLGVFLWLWASPGWATTLVHRPLHERAQSADVIAVVQVLGQSLENPWAEPRQLQTVTRLSVAEYWKGRGPSTLEVIQWGGTRGLWKTHVAGDARFVPGEKAVVLLRCQDKTSLGRCRLVALAEGKITVDEEVSLSQLRKALGLVSFAPKRPKGDVVR